MKVVLLAGGLGSRLSEETAVRPKPMVEIGGKPILWHIMKMYSRYGLNEFIVCLGYKGYIIKEYFANYPLHMSNVTIDLAEGATTVLENKAEPWKVTLVDTGDNTMTGGRLAAVKPYLHADQDFCFTYGDGVSDIPISKLINFHKSTGARCTVTAVQPPGRFGALKMKGDLVASFKEKPIGDGGYINGGFFVASPDVLNLVEGPATIWEDAPMEHLSRRGQLAAFRHDGFWHAMDTLRDKNYLDELWAKNQAPWKSW